MTSYVMTPDGEPVTLADCPIGLFLSSTGNLCLKTEYGSNEGRIDAYIVSSGEMFWGSPPQTIASQRAEIVQPMLAARPSLPPRRPPVTDRHDKALEAAARGMKATEPWSSFWDDKEARELARAAILAFLGAVEVTDATVAAVQRDERWSSFWSPDDAAHLIRAALAQLRRELEG